MLRINGQKSQQTEVETHKRLQSGKEDTHCPLLMTSENEFHVFRLISILNIFQLMYKSG